MSTVMNIYLEFVFFPVHDHSCDLLVHENQNGDQQSRNSSCKVHPPGVSSEWWNKPTSVWTCWLEEEREHFQSNIKTHYLVKNQWERHNFISEETTYSKTEAVLRID